MKSNDYEVYDDEDETANYQQAARCLSLFAQCTKDAVVPQVIDFISNNLLVSSNDRYQQLTWSQKEASIIAFGCMIEGPCGYKTVPLVNQVCTNCNRSSFFYLFYASMYYAQILPVLFSCMNDTSVAVQVAASWTLYQTVRKTIRTLDLPNVLPALIPVVLDGLHSKNQRVVYNLCMVSTIFFKLCINC